MKKEQPQAHYYYAPGPPQQPIPQGYQLVPVAQAKKAPAAKKPAKRPAKSKTRNSDELRIFLIALALTALMAIALRWK